MLKFTPINDDKSTAFEFEELFLQRLSQTMQMAVEDQLAARGESNIPQVQARAENGSIVIEVSKDNMAQAPMEESEEYDINKDQVTNTTDPAIRNFDENQIVKNAIRSAMEQLPTIALEVKRELNGG